MILNKTLTKTMAVLGISTIGVATSAPIFNVQVFASSDIITSANTSQAIDVSYVSSSEAITGTKSIYTLPKQPYKNASMPRGASQDRQALGYIMQPGAELTITNNSDTPIVITLWTNDSQAMPKATTIKPHQNATITALNPPVEHTNSKGEAVGSANDVDLVPFINTPEGDLPTEISIDFSLSGPHKKVPVYNYENDDQEEFLKNWAEGDSYAIIEGKNFQILLPTDDREYVENMNEAPKGFDKNGNSVAIGEGEYVCRNLNDVLHLYDDILFPTYNKLVGLSEDADEVYNQLVNYKYFYTADSHGAGGANYTASRTEVYSYRGWQWLQPEWVIFHETGHGYQSNSLKNPDDHTGEVTNNILAGYVYYHILYKDNLELADKYSWFFNGDKKATETKMNGILNDLQYNWQWNTILPDGKNLGGFSKILG